MSGGSDLIFFGNLWRIHYGLPSWNVLLKGFQFQLISTCLTVVIMSVFGIILTVFQTAF